MKVREIWARLELRLDHYLAEMRPDYDDSITGFNEAYDVVKKFFHELEKSDAQNP